MCRFFVGLTTVFQRLRTLRGQKTMSAIASGAAWCGEEVSVCSTDSVTGPLRSTRLPLQQARQ
ncbi:hypothetical protein YSA_00121 [Pseudomonas putida ND6]|uniref:Uncharacterized protein n=1 Tax=Pseudomonas putida ND6 TaxID=231023 RepID=I3UMX3_PSEPU|nr:hypothetical protein YSA_00121 [Pseudomonas putida ND6]